MSVPAAPRQPHPVSFTSPRHSAKELVQRVGGGESPFWHVPNTVGGLRGLRPGDLASPQLGLILPGFTQEGGFCHFLVGLLPPVVTPAVVSAPPRGPVHLKENK